MVVAVRSDWPISSVLIVIFSIFKLIFRLLSGLVIVKISVVVHVVVLIVIAGDLWSDLGLIFLLLGIILGLFVFPPPIDVLFSVYLSGLRFIHLIKLCLKHLSIRWRLVLLGQALKGFFERKFAITVFVHPVPTQCLPDLFLQFISDRSLGNGVGVLSLELGEEPNLVGNLRSDLGLILLL